MKNHPIGKKFNYWTIIGTSTKKGYWLCMCRCGNVLERQLGNIAGGYSKSCGCRPNKGNTRHGAYGTPEHRTWRHMLERCRNTKCRDWPDYGGRGIAVCERWHDFGLFLADMGERPEGTSLDRVDVNGNYEPSNCRWASAKVQSRNTRRARMVEIDGQTRPLGEWCDFFGVDYHCAYTRIYDQGLPAKDAFARGGPLSVAKRQARMTRLASIANRKLSDDDVRSIRREYAIGGLSQAALGKQYGVAAGYISRVVNRLVYAGIT